MVRARWLEAAPHGWDALRHGDPNATPLHRPVLTRVFAEALPGCAGAFVAVEEDGALIGGAPVVIERRFGLEWLRLMPFTLPGAPLARAGAHATVDRAVAEGLEAKLREVRAVGGEWVLFRPEGPAVDPQAIERVPGETRLTSTDMIDLSAGIEAARRRIHRRTRESLAHTEARGLRCAEERDALDETYALYAAQAREWQGHRLKPITLFRRLLRGDDPAARLFTVRDGRGLLAGAVVLVGDHEWMLWWSGSHPEARRRFGFAALLWSVAEAAARSGARRFNLGASAGLDTVASFKKRLGARPVPVPIRWIGPDHASWFGRAAAALQARARARRWRGTPA